MNDRLRELLIRHHVLDIMAWMMLPDWNNEACRYARHAVHQLRYLLKISGSEIETRQEKLCIPKEER